MHTKILQILSEVRKEIEQLRISIKKAEEIDKLREEVTGLEMELVWAVVSNALN